MLIKLVGVVQERIHDAKSHQNWQVSIRTLPVDAYEVCVVNVNRDDENVDSVHQGAKVMQSEGMRAPFEVNHFLKRR